MPPMEVPPQDQLSRGARIALEPHHAGLPGELPAGPVAVQPIEDLKQHDEYFWKWCVKWTARYVCEERAHGIAKYAQALRVKKDVLERLSPEGLPVLQQYLRKNHPGYAHTRFDEDGGEGEE